MPRAKHQSAAELVRAFLAAQRRELLENEEGTRLGADPECLHRMRVATRRARAALGTAKGALEREQAEGLRAELSWLGGVLGAVRDLDVFIAGVRAESDDLDPGERAAMKPLFARLAAERRKARSTLTRALKSARYGRLLDELAEAAAGFAPSNGKVNLDKGARKQFRRLVKAMDALGSEPSDDELHDVRKLGKRARYAAELAAPLSRKATAKFLRRAKAFQDLAGEHQDAVVAEDKLRKLVADAEAAEAFAAGRLAEKERARQATARAKLPKAWKDLERVGRDTWS